MRAEMNPQSFEDSDASQRIAAWFMLYVGMNYTPTDTSSHKFQQNCEYDYFDGLSSDQRSLEGTEDQLLPGELS